MLTKENILDLFKQKETASLVIIQLIVSEQIHYLPDDVLMLLYNICVDVFPFLAASIHQTCRLILTTTKRYDSAKNDEMYPNTEKFHMGKDEARKCLKTNSCIVRKSFLDGKIIVSCKKFKAVYHKIFAQRQGYVVLYCDNDDKEIYASITDFINSACFAILN